MVGAAGEVAGIANGTLGHIVSALATHTSGRFAELATVDGIKFWDGVNYFEDAEGRPLSGVHVHFDPRDYRVVQIPLVDERGFLVGVGFPSWQNQGRHVARINFLGASMPAQGIKRYFKGDLDTFPFSGIDTTSRLEEPQFHAQSRPAPWAHNAPGNVDYCLFNTKGGLAQFVVLDAAGQAFPLAALPETAAEIIAHSPFLQHEHVVLLGSYAGLGGDTSLASAVAQACQGGPTSTVYAPCGGIKVWPRWRDNVLYGNPDTSWWEDPEAISALLQRRVPATTEITVPVSTVQDALIIQKYGAFQTCGVPRVPPARIPFSL